MRIIGNRNLPAPRSEISDTSPAHHGALDYGELERLGLDPNDVLDFSVNSNPYGPSPAVRRALADVPLDRYPDRECLALRRALSDHWGGLPIEQFVVGNGTAELLWLAAVAYLRPGDSVLVIGPTFGEYERVAALMGAQVVHWTARREKDFAVEPHGVARQLAEMRPRLVFACNPNNPTGVVVPLDVLANWARDNAHTLFVVDEAYLAFAPGLPSAVSLIHPAERSRELQTLRMAQGDVSSCHSERSEESLSAMESRPTFDNVLVMRSMTKDYALAGLRLGYAVGSAQTIGALTNVRPAWNVNALAQAAGLAALSGRAYLYETLEALNRSKASLVTGLAQLGWYALPSAVHFFLLEVGSGAAFRQSLLRHSIQVRDCASFGLPAYVRIAPRRPEENARLLEAMENLYVTTDGR